MTTPLVSIIVPVYKVEAYIRECLDSVLAQNYTNWECICVNDGSPDNSQAILDEYAARDARFRVFRKVNGGVSSARNVGLNAMRGDYFTFLDADDLYKPQALELYMRLATQHDADVVEASAYLFSTDGVRHWQEWEEEWNIVKDAHFLSGVIPSLLLIKPYVCNACYRRVLWEKSGAYFNHEIKIAEDFLFKMKLLTNLEKSYVCSSVPIYGYRKGRDDSAMTQTNASRIASDELKVYKTIFQDWNRLGRWPEVQLDIAELVYNSARNRFPHMPKSSALIKGGEAVLLLLISSTPFTPSTYARTLHWLRGVCRILKGRLKRAN